MRKQICWILICVLTLSAGLVSAYGYSCAVTTMVDNASVARKNIVVIDAGHGEPDGGATSCSGKLESVYNLEIALRLQQLMKLLGFSTVMTRVTEASIYTEGNTIASKKISDLKERVRIVNEIPNAVLVSIHQNHFPDGRYNGAVVLYANTQGSKYLAESMQSSLVDSLNPGSKRRSRQADGVYLMEHIQCPGVLIECGFLSNTAEEAKLRSPGYQKKLCCVIGCAVSNYLSRQEST